jgi:hypothetical protein
MNNNIPAQTEQNQAPTIYDLHRAFAKMCFFYGAIVNNYDMNHKLETNRLRWLADDANKLAAIAMQLHANKGGVQ